LEQWSENPFQKTASVRKTTGVGETKLWEDTIMGNNFSELRIAGLIKKMNLEQLHLTQWQDTREAVRAGLIILSAKGADVKLK
jgi:hypothetical protein